MDAVSLSEIVGALRKAELKVGDIVNVHSRLFSIGRVRDVAVEAIPEIYVRAFREVIGSEGTIVVPTYTTSFGRFGTPFVLEESSSEMGVFSEHVRRSPGAVRSLHPIQSLTALGGRAEALARNHPPWNVGYDTIWDRMLRRGGKVVTLGIPPRRSMSFMHQVELLACVPYLYHKILRGEVYAGGRRVSQDFFLAARYLEYGIAYNLARLEADLVARSAMTEVPLGGGKVWAVPMEAAFEVGMRRLAEDAYYLLQKPPAFAEGRIPCDGRTSEREAAVPRYFLAWQRD